MKKVIAMLAIPLLLLALFLSSTEAADFIIITYADGRTDGGIGQGADSEDTQDSLGDMFVFDQKLLADDKSTVIGRNAGYCIRTDPGAPDFSNTDHPILADDPNNNYSHCTWTLTFYENSGHVGSLTVSGREADLGTSLIPIIGGTGDFTAVTGVLASTPIPQVRNGVLFRQELMIFRDKNESTILPK